MTPEPIVTHRRTDANGRTRVTVDRWPPCIEINEAIWPYVDAPSMTRAGDEVRIIVANGMALYREVLVSLAGLSRVYVLESSRLTEWAS